MGRGEKHKGGVWSVCKGGGVGCVSYQGVALKRKKPLSSGVRALISAVTRGAVGTRPEKEYLGEHRLGETMTRDNRGTCKGRERRWKGKALGW